MPALLARLRHRFAVPWVALLWAATAAVVLVSYPHSNQLVHFASTNLANLARHPVESMALSVVTTTHGWGEWLTWVALAAVWAAIEVELGWRKTLATFVSGHVLATAGLAVIEVGAVACHLAGHGLAWVGDDVGASYGFLALATAGLTVAIRRHRRWWVLAPAIVAISVIDVSVWTMVGHALAITVGVVLGFEVLVRGRRRQPPSASPIDVPVEAVLAGRVPPPGASPAN